MPFQAAISAAHIAALSAPAFRPPPTPARSGASSSQSVGAQRWRRGSTAHGRHPERQPARLGVVIIHALAGGLQAPDGARVQLHDHVSRFKEDGAYMCKQIDRTLLRSPRGRPDRTRWGPRAQRSRASWLAEALASAGSAGASLIPLLNKGARRSRQGLANAMGAEPRSRSPSRRVTLRENYFL